MGFWNTAKKWGGKAYSYTPIGAYHTRVLKPVLDGALHPGDPYKQLSEQLRAMSGDMREFSDTQWDRQMQGLQGAMGQTQGSTDYARMLANQGPGAMEDAWSYLQQQYRNPSNMQQNWAGLSSQLQAPTSTSSVWNQAQSQLRMPTQQQDLSRQSFDPSRTAGAYAGYQNMFQAPGQMEQFGQTANTQLGKAGVGETWQQQNQGNYSQPTSTARLYENNWGGWADAGKTEGFKAQNSTYSQDYGKAANERMSGPTTTMAMAGGIGSKIGEGTFNGSEASQLYRNSGMNDRAQGYYQGANQVQGFAGGLGKQLNDEGLMEQFANKYIQTGSNPFLDRQKQQGTAAINAELASRGKFKSAAGVDRVGSYQGALDAEAFKYAADIAGAGQGAKMSRLGQAQGLAEASSGERFRQGAGLQGLDQAISASKQGVARGLGDIEGMRASNRLGQANALQSLAGQMEGEYQGREGALARAAGMSTDEFMGNQAFDLQSRQASDAVKLQRMAGRDALAGQNDAMNLDWLNSGRDTAFMGQKATEGRLNTLGGIMNNAQLAGLQRASTGMNAAYQTDQDYMAREQERRMRAAGADSSSLAAMLGLNTIAGQNDTENRLRIGDQWDMFQNMDADTISRLSGYGQNANLAQQSQRLRQDDAFRSLLGSDALRSGLYGGFYGQGGQMSGSAYTDSMNALANALGMGAQGNAMNQQAPWDIAGFLAKLGIGMG